MANTNTFVTTDDMNTAINTVKASIPASSQGLTQSDVINLIKSNAPTSTNVTTTKASASLNGVPVTFTRMGNFVVMSGSGVMTSATSLYNVTGLVPAGYRPTYLANVNLGFLYNDNSKASMGFCFVSPNGNLWSSTAASTLMTITYSVSGWWITSDAQPS